MHDNLSFISKKFLIAIIPLILLAPAYTALGASDTSKIALNMDRSVYSIGMKATVVGQVLGSFDPNSPVKINSISPSGISYYSATVSLDSSGGFTYQFTISGDAGLGKNTLEVTHENVYGKISGKITFEVRERASVTIQTEKTSYTLGDDVILQGKVSPILPDSQVLIQVFNPKNNAWAFKSVSSSMISSDGQFTVELGRLEGDLSIPGVYTVKVSYAASTASVTEKFSVVSESSQSQTDNNSKSGQSSTSVPSQVEVVQKETTSTSAAEVAKETVIQSELKNTKEESQEFTYILLIKDSDGITVSLSWARGTLSPNQSLTMGQSWVPEAPGEYTARIFIWESLTNPVVLAPTIVKTITVT